MGQMFNDLWKLSHQLAVDLVLTWKPSNKDCQKNRSPCHQYPVLYLTYSLSKGWITSCYLMWLHCGKVQNGFLVWITCASTCWVFKYDTSLVLEHLLWVKCLRTHGSFLVNWPSISYQLWSPPTRTMKEAVYLAINIWCCIWHTHCRKWSDSLVYSGWHFRWIVFGFCNVHALIVNGLAQLIDDSDPTSLSARYMSSSGFQDKLSHHVST